MKIINTTTAPKVTQRSRSKCQNVTKHNNV